MALLASFEQDFLSTYGPSDFDQRFAELFGLKNGKRLYVGMKSALIGFNDEVVRFTPMRSRRGGAAGTFGPNTPGKEDLFVPFDADDATLGRAALEALDRSECAPVLTRRPAAGRA